MPKRIFPIQEAYTRGTNKTIDKYVFHIYNLIKINSLKNNIYRRDIS